MKFVTNHVAVPTEANTKRRQDQTIEEAIAISREFMSQFTIGRPQATAKWSVEQLEEMGMVGLYREEESLTSSHH